MYAVAGGTWISGVLWLIFHYFLRTEGRFGFRNHPLEAWWLKLHAAFSFGFLWILGVLWITHVLRGWHMRWRRRSGGALVGIALFLTVTGYGLYYIDARTWQEWTGIAHWAVGFAAIAAFFAHRLSKSRARRS